MISNRSNLTILLHKLYQKIHPLSAAEIGGCLYVWRQKDTRPAQLIAAIKGTVAGETFLDPAIAGRVLQQATHTQGSHAPPTNLIEELTPRELDVLALVVKGMNNHEIGEQLHLVTGTVRNHISEIMGKMAVSDRTQAAVLAVQMGLVDFM